MRPTWRQRSQRATRGHDRVATDKGSAGNRWRGFVLNGALLAGSLVVALLLGEIVVRIFVPQQLIMIRPDIWEPADTLGYVARPNVNTTVNTGERTVHLYTDSLGMRVGAGGRTHAHAKTRVLVMGDSFMEALQVEYPQSFPALLEEGLTRRLGRPVSVWDAGVDGWDPPQYLVRTRQILAHHSFNLVVVALYLGNDLVISPRAYRPPRHPAERHHFRLPRNLSRKEIVDATLYPINDFLEVRSQLFIFFRTRLRTLLTRLGLSAMDIPVGILRRDASSPMWNVTAHVCANIATLAAQHGARTIFALIPPEYAVVPTEAAQIRDGFGIDSSSVDGNQPNRLLLRALRALHLTAVPAEPAFDSAAVKGVQIYGTVDRHLTPDGHRLLERVVEPVAANALASGARDAR